MWPEHLSKEKLLSDIIMHRNAEALEKLEQLKGLIFYEISDIVHHVIWYRNEEVANYVVEHFKIPFMPRCVKDILVTENEALLHIFSKSTEYDVPQMALAQCVKDNNEKMFTSVSRLDVNLKDSSVWAQALIHSNETIINTIIASGFEVKTEGLKSIIVSQANQANKNRILKNILDEKNDLLTPELIDYSMNNKMHHISFQLLKRWDKQYPQYDWLQSKWLIKSCMVNDNKSTQFLLKKQVDIEQLDNAAIYHAAHNYNTKLCELLLSYGAMIPDRTYKNLDNHFSMWLSACPKYLHLSKKLEKSLPVNEEDMIDEMKKMKI
jgi:hypothetical protein